MAKFPEAEARKFKNKFVCRRCKSVIRAPNLKILAGNIKCRKCNNRAFKPKRKKQVFKTKDGEYTVNFSYYFLLLM